MQFLSVFPTFGSSSDHIKKLKKVNLKNRNHVWLFEKNLFVLLLFQFQFQCLSPLGYRASLTFTICLFLAARLDSFLFYLLIAKTPPGGDLIHSLLMTAIEKHCVKFFDLIFIEPDFFPKFEYSPLNKFGAKLYQ